MLLSFGRKELSHKQFNVTQVKMSIFSGGPVTAKGCTKSNLSELQEKIQEEKSQARVELPHLREYSPQLAFAPLVDLKSQQTFFVGFQVSIVVIQLSTTF